VTSRYVAMVAAGAKPCRTMQLGLPFASCPGLETIKAAAVLRYLAAVVAAEYNGAVTTRKSITGSATSTSSSKRKIELFPLHAFWLRDGPAIDGKPARAQRLNSFSV